MDDEFYVANEAQMLELKNEELEAIEGYLKSNKRKNAKRFYTTKKVDTIENGIERSDDLRRNKMLVKLNTPSGTAVKQIALKPQKTVKCTSSFLAGKMLMFAKLSLKSFIYAIAELFMFPDATVREIYDRYQIEKVYVYHVLTDTDSTCIQFLVISSVNSMFTEPQVRDIIFEVFSRTPIVDRFDKSDPFWKRFNVQDPTNQKVLELYEVESIDDPSYVTLAVNPKEYFEYFKSQNMNKKHKGIKKGAPGMNYQSFAERIKPLHSFNTFQKPRTEKKKVVCFTVKKGTMTTLQVEKNKFSQINDKRFYFPNAIVSLPHGHPALKKLDKYKKKKGQRIESYFLQKKEKLLELERQALAECPRLELLECILFQPFKLVHRDSTSTYLRNPSNEKVIDFILGQRWLQTKDSPTTTIPTTDNSKVIS